MGTEEWRYSGIACAKTGMNAEAPYCGEKTGRRGPSMQTKEGKFHL